MENKLEYMEDILSRSISGFHAYSLSEPVHLQYVSRNFCEMTGYVQEELLSEEEDLYASLVHPLDRDVYSKFIDKFKSKEQTLTCEYRLMKKDGGVLFVSDTVTSRRLEDGAYAGYSVLVDITEAKKEDSNLQFFKETIPCGFMRCTCEKQPKITYINQQMMDFLRLPRARDGELDYLELYKENIYLMVPMEERRRFARYLERVYAAAAPIAGEMELLRCDGTRAYMFGWVAKCVNEQGEEEIQCVCMDVTERYKVKKADEEKRYLKALTDIYDKIFEYDLGKNTVKCLYSNNSPMFKWLEDVPMQMEEATERWIAGTVDTEDGSRVRQFFQDFFQKNLCEPDDKPPQITYKSQSSSGEKKLYSGIFLKMDESVSLYCCRCVPDSKDTAALRDENAFLKENMQELATHFTDSVAAFAVTEKYVTPLYASDNICEFFGFAKEAWLSMLKKETPIEEFFARSHTDYEDFARLLRVGESEFSYIDLESGNERRVKAVCSQKSPGGSAPRYVMLYHMDGAQPREDKSMPANPAVFIRMFGYFDVFVGEKPIAFRNKKAKELFALLADRRGGYVTSEEAISFLWEDEPVSPVTLSRYRKVALRLKNTLAEYGISEVMETVDGKRRIVAENVQCDLYDYLSGEEAYAQLFKGSYLNNYSWGEHTLAELTGDIL